jgi:hypothetical protein
MTSDPCSYKPIRAWVQECVRDIGPKNRLQQLRIHIETPRGFNLSFSDRFVLKDRPAYSLLEVSQWWLEFHHRGAIANAQRIWRAKGGQIYISNPHYQHALEPLADLFSIEGVLVTGAVTDKFANQLQTAVAKSPGIFSITCNG